MTSSRPTPRFLGQRSALLGSFVVLLASCSTVTTFAESEGTGGQSASGDSESEDSGGILPTSHEEVSSTGSGSSSSTGSSGSTGELSGADGNSFINDPTFGSCGGPLPDGVVGSTAECSVLDQDCCPGEACRAWANDGGGDWNATRCSPVDPDAAAAGEPCTVVGNAASGADSCDVGLMCWEVDPDTLEGTCIEYCTGPSDDPVCSSPDDVCGVYNYGVLSLCLPSCDLLANDCEAEEACVPAQSGFGCIDERYARCPAGMTEIDPLKDTNCDQDEPCCAPYCELSDGASCGEDLECVPLRSPYDELPDVGACVPTVEPA